MNRSISTLTKRQNRVSLEGVPTITDEHYDAILVDQNPAEKIVAEVDAIIRAACAILRMRADELHRASRAGTPSRMGNVRELTTGSRRGRSTWDKVLREGE